jgi:hypothetical protein
MVFMDANQFVSRAGPSWAIVDANSHVGRTASLLHTTLVEERDFVKSSDCRKSLNGCAGHAPPESWQAES